MYKKLLFSMVFLAVLTTLLAACSIVDSAAGPTGPTVHMGNASFIQSSITISKGESLSVVDDVAVEHIIVNGTWKGSTAAPSKESGAPVINQTFNGNDTDSFGPFNTSGTFHFYCTIHPGMNLSVTVQ